MRLWAQGGTPTDPVNQARFPDRYGFGSLRCAVDNLNGDNVEFIAFPQGDRHVFCYAYYVTPPPTSATIRIVKQVPAGDTSSETFQFGGTVSYNPGGSFDLQVVNGAPASETFVRAETRTGVAPWVVTETSPPDWRLRGAPVCTTTNGSTFVIVGDRVEITLKARDEAVCTYTNEPIPATQLTLRKVTLGGVGRFDFRVTPAGLPVVTTSITTTQPGVAVAAPPIATTATSYDITETAPTSALGTWRLAAVMCDGVAMPVSQPVHVTVVNGEQPVCTFTNAFVPRGSLTIRKITLGATASLDFLVTRPNDPEFNAFKTATTTSIGVAATAKGDPTNALALGTYHVDELTPTTGSGGTWALTSVVCDGSRLRPINLGSISVTLTPAKPHQTCVFTDTFTADPTPNPSGGVLPTDGGLTPPPTATLAAVASVPRTPGLAIALGLIFASLVVAVLALQSRRAR